MNFSKLPFDSHTCTIRIGIYDYTASEVILEWNAPSNGLIDTIGNPFFGLSSDRVWEARGSSSNSTIEAYTGTPYSICESSFKLARVQRNPYISNYLTMSIIMVFISYMGFYIEASATPGRVAVALLSLLIVNNLRTAMLASLPNGYQQCWLGEFMLGCFWFNVLAMVFFTLELIGIEAKAGKEAKAGNSAAPEDIGVSTQAQAQVPNAIIACLHCAAPHWLARLSDLDRFLRIWFPIFYIVFVIAMFLKANDTTEL